MNDQRQWRSLREANDPESVREARDQEFMPGVTEGIDPSTMTPISRKRFLALAAASAAFAAAGCTNYRDKGEIVPYDRKPEEVTPGVANAYASTCTACSQGCGILVKTREGRPVKIDGNPEHPVNKGKVCATGQAAILNLYDPSRLRQPHTGAAAGRSGDASWDQVDADTVRALAATLRDNRTVLIVTRPSASPTVRSVLADFAAAFPRTMVVSYDRTHEETRRRAWTRCYGSGVPPVILWEQAKVIVTLEADILGTEGFTVEQTRKFAAGRDVMVSDDFNRLYAVEGDFSITGANADQRLRLRPDAQLEFVLGLLNELGGQRKISASLVPAAARGVSLQEVVKRHALPAPAVSRLIADLAEHRGRAMVYAGAALPEDVHVAVNALNEALGNTALYGTAEIPATPGVTGVGQIGEAVRAMKAGTVGVVIHCDVNPVYHLPRELGYPDALKAVPFSVALVEAENETARLCTYMLPIHHALESWGDMQVRAGTYSLQQPVVAPLYATRQKEAVLLHWMAAGKPFAESLYHEYLRGRWEKAVFAAGQRKTDFATFWYSVLHDGIVVMPSTRAERPMFRVDALRALQVAGQRPAWVLSVTPPPFVGDGAFANNGWLQELPHPVTKVVWDNYAAVAPATARELGVASNDCIVVTTAAGKQTLPVFVQPGIAEHLVCVALGYGRWDGGPIGSGVGTDVTPLLPKESLNDSRILPLVSVLKTDGHYLLASTQEHHSLDDSFVKDLHLKRHIIREGTLDEYHRDPQFLQHGRKEYQSISTEVGYPGVKWGMAIDLNKCTGCNACVAGCNVENNIPTVGKEQVDKGREMQWIRIDRYFSGTPEDPLPSHQPMLCQHCDNAPCENVCPVVATNHSPDGLNQMIYNRCVGTKYCSNNCPYKVRRFNFLNFRDNLADGYYLQEPLELMHNPEVTIRSRGVMEKCTFCVQRIMEARQHATEAGTTFTGKGVETACQQACPAEAIVFGNVNDPESAVARYRAHALGYHVLEDLNVRPNVTYLARLRNIQTEKNA